MGRLKNPNTIEVHKGLYLKRHCHSQPWQCYFRLNHQQFRKSTKTADLQKAKLIALQWLTDALDRGKNGSPIRTVPFTELCKSYLAYFQSASKLEYHSATIERHLMPFFNSYPDITKIRTSDVQEYISYRCSKSPAKPQTLNRENTVLRQLLRFGWHRGWINHEIVVEHFNENLTRRRRPHFTATEYQRLCRVAQNRIWELEGQPLRTFTLWQRQLLYGYVRFLANTGLRVDEAKTLIWRNVDLEERILLVEHAGKTKQSRTVWIRTEGVEALLNIKSRRLSYLKDRRLEPLFSTEKVFCLPDGTPVVSLKRSFNALLKSAGFEYSELNEKHVLTSLRHTYATERLTAPREQRATTKSLALQMGTSVRMIERYYGHDQIRDYEMELAG